MTPNSYVVSSLINVSQSTNWLLQFDSYELGSRYLTRYAIVRTTTNRTSSHTYNEYGFIDVPTKQTAVNTASNEIQTGSGSYISTRHALLTVQLHNNDSTNYIKLAVSSLHYTTIILASPVDWDEWLDAIETKARGEKIWEHINPSTATSPPLIKPHIPAQSPEPTATEKEMNRVNIIEYKQNRLEYEIKERHLSDIMIHIKQTISRDQCGQL
ncbi:MAG: hypothetical protein MMC33_010551 [Icmadophila ericetorum]|nr:hypothetical protein [Icmadophila ericetorum]